jgi:hypothetical protein
MSLLHSALDFGGMVTFAIFVEFYINICYLSFAIMTGSRAGCRKNENGYKANRGGIRFVFVVVLRRQFMYNYYTNQIFFAFFYDFFFVNFARQTIMAAMVFSFNTELNEFNKINY